MYHEPAVKFQLIDNELHYCTMILSVTNSTFVNDDGDDCDVNERVVVSGWTNWMPIPHPESVETNAKTTN